MVSAMPDFSIGCKMTQKNRTSFMYDPIPYFLCGNYSFLNLEIVANSCSQRNVSIFQFINRIFAGVKGRNYVRKYDTYSLQPQKKIPDTEVAIFLLWNIMFITKFGKTFIFIQMNVSVLKKSSSFELSITLRIK